MAKMKIYMLDEGDGNPEFFKSKEQAEEWKYFYIWCDPEPNYTIKEVILNDENRLPPYDKYIGGSFYKKETNYPPES